MSRPRLGFLAPAALLVSAFPVRAQAGPEWSLRAQTAYYELHVHDEGYAISSGVVRRGGSLLVGFDVVRALSRAQFTSADLSLELHPFWRRRLSPFVGVGTGFMLEDDFRSAALPYFGRLGAQLRMGTMLWLRVAAQRSSHKHFGGSGTFSGPQLYLAGLVIRLRG